MFPEHCRQRQQVIPAQSKASMRRYELAKEQEDDWKRTLLKSAAG
jgi:hypothetical protein